MISPAATTAQSTHTFWSKPNTPTTIRPLPPIPILLPPDRSTPTVYIRSNASSTVSLNSPRPLPLPPGFTSISLTSPESISFPDMTSRVPSASFSPSRSFSSLATSEATPSSFAFSEDIAPSAQCDSPSSQSATPILVRRTPSGACIAPDLQIVPVPLAPPTTESPVTPDCPSPMTDRDRRMICFRRRSGEDVSDSIVKTVRPNATQITLRRTRQDHILIPSNPLHNDNESDDDWDDISGPPKPPPKPSLTDAPSLVKLTLSPLNNRKSAVRRKRESKPPFVSCVMPELGNLQVKRKWSVKISSAKSRSAKWTRIKRGKEVESDYADVINALRML